MQSEILTDSITLSSGQVLSVFNCTKVYFGDYHHVKLEIRGQILSANSNRSALYCRTLEKMAVPAAEIDSTIQKLLVEFKNNSLTYLNSPDFAEKFVEASLLSKKPAFNRYYGLKSSA